MAIDYKKAGVDISAGEDTVKRIVPLVRTTFTPEVLADIGLFGGFYDAKFPNYKHPILVASVDGVGTKLKIAVMTGIHNTVGQCLVNHCTNDILCCGAKPLFFLDYFATGALEPNVAEKVIEGFCIACRENACSLIGGETAEMPSMYQQGEYDMSGTIIGVVDKERIINGKKIQKGDVLIGLKSTGLHTNGYSLARAALLDKYSVNHKFDELTMPLGEELLQVHKSYLHNVMPLLDMDLIHGISHITGGGIVGNTKRILPKELSLDIDWNSWDRLPIFNIIQREAGIDEEEMRHVFNLGIGMILVVNPNNTDKVMELCQNDSPKIIGSIK